MSITLDANAIVVTFTVMAVAASVVMAAVISAVLDCSLSPASVATEIRLQNKRNIERLSNAAARSGVGAAIPSLERAR